MKHKIYIVHENVGFMGEIQQRMIRAFACKRTAKKFIDYKNLKLAALKDKFKGIDPLALQLSDSKQAETKLNRLSQIYYTNEYVLKEVDLHH